MSLNYRHIYIWGGHALALDYFTKITAARQSGLCHYEDIFFVTDDQDCLARRKFPDQMIPLSAADFTADYLKKKSRPNGNGFGHS